MGWWGEGDVGGTWVQVSQGGARVGGYAVRLGGCGGNGVQDGVTGQGGGELPGVRRDVVGDV